MDASENAKIVPRGQAHIHATFNNTLVTITDMTGNPVAWGSAGAAGFKGSRKSTPFAAQMSAETAARRAMEQGMQTVDVFVKGRARAASPPSELCNPPGSTCCSITDVTPVPHNGTRPRKRRRV